VRRNGPILAGIVLIVAGMLFAARMMVHRPHRGNFVGQPAPEFTLKTLDGKEMKLADLRGKAVLLNFWATWCGPCKIEMPWFEKLQATYGPQGLQVIGVAMDDASPQEIAKFAKDEVHVTYPILLGTEAVGTEYGGIEFLPTTYFIDRNGKIVERAFGLKGRGELEDDVKLALGTGAPGKGE
jgi:cytochrome c biogenesis protein CcmG/thiol:disulfide interchange protein DsbE